MKLLCIDVGNSHTVIGAAENGRITGSWRMRTDRNRTADETLLWLKEAASLAGMEDIPPIALSSVVPGVTHPFMSLSDRLKVFVVNNFIKKSFELNLPRPETLGADLIADAEAAVREYGTPAIIVDAGTATTISVIDTEKNYIGGIIAPGLKISEGALYEKAAKLAAVPLKKIDNVVGNTTETCIISGVTIGHAAMVDGLVEKIKSETGIPNIKTVITGGCAPLFRSYCNIEHKFDPDLTLKGLLYLYEINN